MRMRLFGLVAACLAVTAMSVPPVAAKPARFAPVATTTGSDTVHWGACAEPELRSAHAQCGTVGVPLDYSRPDGTTVSIAVSRVRHTVAASRFLGVILVNPGGPGGSGLYLATQGSAVPHGVGNRYDWIGFDPRGVGASRPRLHCDNTITAYDRPDYRATTPALQAYWLNRAKTYAQACGRNNLALLQHDTTEDTVRDMDAIRVALGVQRISFYGYSYGTYLGDIYATLFPTHLFRMVLDSNVDPRRVWYPAQLDQDVAFQTTIRRFFGWIAHYHSVYRLGRTEKAVEAGFDAQLTKLRRHPVAGKLGPDELTDALTDAAYYAPDWPDDAKAYAALVRHGRAAGLLALYGGPGDDNENAAYDAVQCTDAAWPANYATWKRDAIRVNRKAPFLTWDNVWDGSPCLFWPVQPGRPITPNLKAAPPTLLIDQTLDPATPYSGSIYVRSIFPRSRLLAIPGGTTHADSLDGIACEDHAIAAYLATGALPARRAGNRADKTCALPAGRRPDAAAALLGSAVSATRASGMPGRDR